MLPRGRGYFLQQAEDGQDVFLGPGLLPKCLPPLQVGGLLPTGGRGWARCLPGARPPAQVPASATGRGLEPVNGCLCSWCTSFGRFDARTHKYDIIVDLNTFRLYLDSDPENCF